MSKRIALVGNMNNNFFALVRYLRDEGYDAHLFYRLSVDHFQPKSDTYSLGFTEYCHEIDWLDKGFHSINVDTVKKDLNGFDLIIGQGDEAAVAYFCGFKTNVYYPYGSDVYKFAQLFQEYSIKHRISALLGRSNIPLSKMKYGTMFKYLRGAIADADYILSDYTNEDFEERLAKLQPKGQYDHVPAPMLYDKEYEQLLETDHADVHWKSVIDKIREENEFLLLYHGRQEWKTIVNDFTCKNTHHVIEGFASYVKKNKERKAKLVMLEYGTDTHNSKILIKELGIEDRVVWFPKMYRKDLMYLIKNMDVCSGEFGRSYLIFGTVVEAMLMKKPLIHYRDDSIYDNYERLYPLFNAREPEEIEARIAEAIDNPDKTKAMGAEAAVWVKEFLIKRPLKHLIDIIEKL